MKSTKARMRPLKAIVMMGVLPVVALVFPAGIAYANAADECDKYNDSPPNSYGNDAKYYCGSKEARQALIDNDRQRNAQEEQGVPLTDSQREQQAMDDKVYNDLNRMGEMKREQERQYGH